MQWVIKDTSNITLKVRHYKKVIRYLCLVIGVSGVQVAQVAQAGLFDDEIARQNIAKLQKDMADRAEVQNKSILEFSNQIQQLREENAQLRGQIENFNYKLEAVEKRQQDFYIDLDARLRKVETQTNSMQSFIDQYNHASASEKNNQIDNKDNNKQNYANVAETVNENPAELYEAALTHFKGGKYREAAAAFDAFGMKFPTNALAPGAMLWLGYSYAAQQDCKRASTSYQNLLAKWPNSSKAPDAMYAYSECQASPAAKLTLQKLTEKYPNSNAAEKARKRLKAN